MGAVEFLAGWCGGRGIHRAIITSSPAPLTLILAPKYPGTNAFVGDWYQHAKYATIFLGGYLLAREAGFWRRIVVLSQTAQTLYLWTALLAILGWGKVFLDRPFRWLPYCTEAVYSWYMLHQSLIILLLFWLKPMSLGPWMEPALVVGGTVAGCLALHEFLIRRVAFLRPLFGLKAAKRTSRAALAGTDSSAMGAREGV